MAFGRAVRVRIGTITVDSTDSLESLRVAFSVKRDKSRDPDSAELVLFNLSEATRSSLDGHERLLCRIEAGYRDEGVKQIFFGYMHDVVHSKDGTEWVTQISIVDDAKKKRSKVTRVHHSFAKNSSIAQALKTLVKATGIPEGNLAQFAAVARLRGSPLLPRAWNAHGQALEELNGFCRSMGWEFSIKEGAFQFIEIGAALLGTGPLIYKESGMIGAPSVDSEGNVTVISLMLPDIRPGQAFRVESDINGSGTYFATAVEHLGDTHGKDWYAKIEGQPLKPGFKPPSELVVN